MHFPIYYPIVKITVYIYMMVGLLYIYVYTYTTILYYLPLYKTYNTAQCTLYTLQYLSTYNINCCFYSHYVLPFLMYTLSVYGFRVIFRRIRGLYTFYFSTKATCVWSKMDSVWGSKSIFFAIEIKVMKISSLCCCTFLDKILFISFYFMYIFG